MHQQLTDVTEYSSFSCLGKCTVDSKFPVLIINRVVFGVVFAEHMLFIFFKLIRGEYFIGHWIALEHVFYTADNLLLHI